MQAAFAPRMPINHFWDPEASRIVSTSACGELTLVTNDASRDIIGTGALLKQATASDHPVAQYVAMIAWPDCPLWDETATAVWLGPSIVTRQTRLAMDVDRMPGGNIAAPIADPAGPDKDRGLDAARHPAEILAFLHLKPGATIADIWPGDYWDALFSDAVEPTGKVFAVHLPLADKEEKIAHPVPGSMPLAGHGNVIAVVSDPATLTLPGRADVIWIRQNYHDLYDPFMGPVDVPPFDKAAFRALKPGGRFVVIDHVAPAGSRLASTDTTHRIDPEVVKADMKAAGFRFVGESNALRNPADPHTALVFDASIRGHTDQFVYVFQRPRARRPTVERNLGAAATATASAGITHPKRRLPMRLQAGDPPVDRMPCARYARTMSTRTHTLPLGPIVPHAVRQLPPLQRHIGRSVSLEPLALSHAGELLEAAQGGDASWAYMRYGPFALESDLRAHLAPIVGVAHQPFFAIIPKASGRAEGWFSFCDVAPGNASIEIGHVWFSPRLQRTRAATEAIFLLMEHAFALGYHRLVWRCNALNAASMRAARRFGFTYEGTWREAEIVKGRRRETAWFSLLEAEWPEQRARFAAWLADSNFDASGTARRSLNPAAT